MPSKGGAAHARAAPPPAVRTAEVQTGGTGRMVRASGVSACGVALYTAHVERKGVCARAERGMPVGAARKPKRLT